MKLSEWVPAMQSLIDGIQGEVDIPVPALDEFRGRLGEAVSSAQTRERFWKELEAFLDSQAFLREATARYLAKKATEALASSAALVERIRQVLPGSLRAREEATAQEITDASETETSPFTVVEVGDVIKAAERVLPGHAAPEGKSDPRWQAIIKIEDYIEEEPDAIWAFILRWGSNPDEDLRSAIATLLLEHLLGCHFDRFFPLVDQTARGDALFADTFLRCWKFGQAKEEKNAKRFDALREELRKTGSQT